jgi:uncharacterized membrane protein
MRVGAVARIVAYLATLVVLCAFNGVWLTTMLPIYQRGLGGLLAATPALAPWALFYLLQAAGVVRLVVLPGVPPGALGRRWTGVAARGALLAWSPTAPTI